MPADWIDRSGKLEPRAGGPGMLGGTAWEVPDSKGSGAGMADVTGEIHSMPGEEADSSLGAGGWLVLWATLLVALHAVVWVAGFPTLEIATGVESGAARIEARSVGETSDDLLRKAIQLQQDTRPFWLTLAALGDFVFDPARMALRTCFVAIGFAAIAALTGRPIGFGRALTDSARLQGLWVLGLAMRVALMVVLRRPDADTSLALFLPPGAQPAMVWLFLRQADVFALIGWLMLLLGGWRRGQANLFLATFLILTVMLTEMAVSTAGAAAVGAGMRLSILP